jgi:hypothetical protein
MDQEELKKLKTIYKKNSNYYKDLELILYF